MAIRTRRLFPDGFALCWRSLSPEINASVGYHAPVNPGHTIQTLIPLMQANRVVAFVLYDDEDPLTDLGVLFGYLFPNVFTGELEALEGGWFVRPCARNGENALLLLRAFEEFAKSAGCLRVLSGSTVSYRAPGMGRLYRRLGYKLHAEAFSKEL